jgi:predicted AAA+ superfamily ATPase
MYPLVSSEVNFEFNWPDALGLGFLPQAFGSADAKAYLKAYDELYLQEEIKAEALTRNIEAFARFLEVASRQNAQVTNVAGISRDAQVARQTVAGFFEILVATMIGYWLPACKLKRVTKQKAHPNFYFFDCGVVRSLSGRGAYPVQHEEKGALFKTTILNEVRAFLSYMKLDYPIFYWSSHDDVEVDLILETTKGFVAIEIKSSPRWENRFNAGFNRLREDFEASKLKPFGVYLGERKLMSGHATVYPGKEFLKALWDRNII